MLMTVIEKTDDTTLYNAYDDKGKFYRVWECVKIPDVLMSRNCIVIDTNTHCRLCYKEILKIIKHYAKFSVVPTIEFYTFKKDLDFDNMAECYSFDFDEKIGMYVYSEDNYMPKSQCYNKSLFNLIDNINKNIRKVVK